MSNTGASYRTRMHATPANMPTDTVLTEHGWGTVAVNYSHWRSASAAKVMVPMSWRWFPGEATEVELLTFQMVMDAPDGDGSGEPRFNDLVARGYVRAEDGEATLRAWCERGEIPIGFKLARRLAA